MANLPKGKITFTLVFSDTSPWTSVFAFERDFAEYFATKGWLAYRIPGPEGDSHPLLWLDKLENTEKGPQPPPAPKPVSQQLSNVTQKMRRK